MCMVPIANRNTTMGILGKSPTKALQHSSKPRGTEIMLITTKATPANMPQSTKTIKQVQAKQVIHEAIQKAALLAVQYGQPMFKTATSNTQGQATEQIYYLTSARRNPARRGGGVNTTYHTEAAILAYSNI